MQTLDCGRGWGIGAAGCLLFLCTLQIAGCRLLAPYQVAKDDVALDASSVPDQDAALDVTVDAREDSGDLDPVAEGAPALLDGPEDIPRDQGGAQPNGPVCWRSWCFEHPLPTGIDLYAVDCYAPDACLAVGSYGLVLRFDGMGWRAVPHGTQATLLAVRMISKQVGFTAGAGGTLLKIDGSTVTSEASPSSQELRALWHDGATIYVGGQEGLHSRPIGGSSWTKLLGGTVVALWGSGGELFIGTTVALYQRSGGKAPVKRCSTGGSVYAIDGPSSAEVYFIEYNGAVRRLQGGNCSHLQALGADARALAYAAGQVYAASGSEIKVYDGTNWSSLTLDAVRAMVADQSVGVWAVGLRGSLRRVVGTSVVAQDKALTTAPLEGAVETAQGPLAVARNGTLLRHTPQGWQLAFGQSGALSLVLRVTALDHSRAYLAAWKSGLQRLDSAGYTQLLKTQTLAVAFTGAAVFAGHAAGQVSRVDPLGNVQSLSSPLTGAVRDIEGSASALYFAAGPQVGFYDGTKLSVVWSDPAALLQVVAASSAGAVVAGKGGRLLLCELPGPNCSLLATLSEEVVSVALRSLDDFYVATKSGAVTHYVKRAPGLILDPPLSSLKALTVDGAGVLRVYGGAGLVLRYAP